MKKLFQKLLFSGLVFLQSQLIAVGQTAELQVIHNSADPAAATVDVYVNGILTLDDFAFRTATPFIPVPAGVTLEIGVAPGSSTSVADTLKNFSVVLTANDRYIAVANGVLNPANFDPNPDGTSTGFTLFLQNNIRNVAQNAGVVDFVALHGATDAPTVDIVARNITTLVDNASYSNITNYISVPPATYIVDVTDSSQANIVATYSVDLSGLSDSTAVVFASGFLSPASNQNGPAFGLFGAFANGTVVEFPAVSIAFLQAIHNCSDPAADSVDIYALGALAVDNFKYRTATNFIAVPAGILLNVGVAPGNSTSVNDTIKNFPVTLENGKNYIAMATGVINPANFAVNPDGKNIGFNLLVADYAKLSAANAGDVDFIAIHGCTDAPTVDVKVNSGGPILVDNASFGDATPYIGVPAASYFLDVTPGNNNAIIVATYLADLSLLSGQSAVVFASGFLNPAANQNGPSFGLFAALNDGTVIPFANVTGVEENGINNADIYAGPNPAYDYVNIVFNKISTNSKQISMTNTVGQLVHDLRISGNNNVVIDTKNLNSGLYFIRITDGNSTTVKKVIIN